MRKKIPKKEKPRDLSEVIADSIFAYGAKMLRTIFAILKGKQTFSKVMAFLLILPMALGLSRVGTTNAYFNDTESSTGNIFSAAFLDFFLSETEFDTFIGKEALGEYSVASAVVETTGSLDIQYAVNVEKISGDDDFCGGLLLETTKNGIEVHDADVFSFSGATSTVFGTWEFEYDLPPSVTTIGHGDECDFDIVYTGWRADSTPEESGYDDEERIRFELTSKMVVMNEMLPDPTGSDSQSGLSGEWVELYNNGDTDVDVGGWSISELSDPSGTPTEEFYTIVASSPGAGEVETSSGSTVLTAGGFLVIVFSAERLNNDGDTVTLYDGSLGQMDQHQYVDGEAPEGKSIARIPDGIGIWVDPIPTPGGVNIDGELPVATAVQDGEEVYDLIPPVIVINGNNPAMITVGSGYADLGAVVTDNVNNNLGISVTGAEIDTSLLGTYTVSYTATDQAGNTTTVERQVIVYNPEFGIPETEEVVVEEVSVIEETPEPQNLIEQFIVEVAETFIPQSDLPDIEAETLESSVEEVEEQVEVITPVEQLTEEEPVTEESVVEIIVETSTTTELVVEELVVATTTEPIVETPTETSTTTESIVEELVVEEIVAETPTTTEEIIATEELVIEEPVTEEPAPELATDVVEEPAIVEDPIIEPVVEEPTPVE